MKLGLELTTKRERKKGKGHRGVIRFWTIFSVRMCLGNSACIAHVLWQAEVAHTH